MTRACLWSAAAVVLLTLTAAAAPAAAQAELSGVWQPRYWEHRIRDETDWYRHRDYIHLNPVKHGYVTSPEEWPWSSFHQHVRLGWLDRHWPGSSPVDLPRVSHD